MNVTIKPGLLSGTLIAPPSKSCAHRILICAALSLDPVDILCGQPGQDVLATIACLQALGATITETSTGYHIEPVRTDPKKAILPCGESGSTLRFLLPVVGAMGVAATFQLEGMLPQRPLSPLWEEMQRMGCRLSRPTGNTVLCSGKLQKGLYRLNGSVSSQFITGMLFAQLVNPGIQIKILGQLQSAPYVELTKEILRHPPTCVEGDWSNAAFFLGANFLGSQVKINGLSPASFQGDKAVCDLLGQPVVDAGDVPDLIPILAVAAAFGRGCVFKNTGRLRLKESDRVQSIQSMITALGGGCQAEENRLTVFPVPLQGGVVDAQNDHRIAMAAAIAATRCSDPVTIVGAQCVEKSYPAFWQDFQMLGGKL